MRAGGMFRKQQPQVQPMARANFEVIAQ